MTRTVGVEEELLLVDAGGVPRPLGDDVVESAGGGDSGVERELKREQVELATEPCEHLADVGDQLRALRRRVDDAASRHGLRLAALATSPLPVEPTATPDARYERMHREYGITVHELLCNGCHVHVAVESADEAVAVLDRIRPWLAVLTAVSANSPFWQGVDTGYASYRQRVWSRWPSSGPTEPFGDANGYQAAIAAMVSSGAAIDEEMAYLDARASKQWPTIEIRVLDVCLDVDDAVLLTGLIRGLVETAAAEWRDGRPPQPVRLEVLRGAAWRAARSGLGGDLVDPVSARTVPARAQVERLLAYATPALAAYGDLDLVTRQLKVVLERGTGADAQRTALARRGELSDVVADAVERTNERPAD